MRKKYRAQLWNECFGTFFLHIREAEANLPKMEFASSTIVTDSMHRSSLLYSESKISLPFNAFYLFFIRWSANIRREVSDIAQDPVVRWNEFHSVGFVGADGATCCDSPAAENPSGSCYYGVFTNNAYVRRIPIGIQEKKD